MSHATVSVSDRKRLEGYLAALGKDDVMADYLRTSYAIYRSGKNQSFRGLAKRAQSGLFGLLASYRDTLTKVSQGKSRKDARTAYERFVNDHRHVGLRYVLAHRFQSRWRWKAPVESAEVWQLVGRGVDSANPWATIAMYEAGRVLYDGRKYNDAVVIYERLLKAGGLVVLATSTIGSCSRSAVAAAELRAGACSGRAGAEKCCATANQSSCYSCCAPPK